MKHLLSICKKFYAYQRERFPLALLGLSILPAVLSSGAVVTASPRGFQIAEALIASLAYLLHIRVIDEHRDFDHDNLYHATRPVQSGIISTKELRQIDIFAVTLLLLVATVSGTYALAVAVSMLAYAYIAGKEFFIGERIRSHFFIYNGVNLVQMLLMQIFVYTVFAHAFQFTTLIWSHFLFTTVGTLIFEFIRKLKRPGKDGIGNDTYTWYLGFNLSMCIYILLLVMNALLFVWISSQLSLHMSGIYVCSLVLAVLALLLAVLHWVLKKQETDQLMQGTFLLLYGVFNLSIYFYL